MPTLAQALAAILSRINAVINLVNSVIQLLNSLGIQIGEPAQQHSVDDVLTDTATIIAMLSDAGFGLAKIESDQNTNTATILSAVADAQQTGSPVTLPTTPPAGYGGGDPTSIAGYVWGYSLPSGQDAGDQQDNAGNFAVNHSVAGSAFLGLNSSWFTLAGSWASDTGPDSSTSAPHWPASAVLADDTLLTFLDRESLYTGWALDSDSHAWVRQDTAFNDFIYTSILDAASFLQYRDAIFSVVSATGAPVWPGVDLAVFGTTQDISDGASISEDMSGIIVVITSVPPNTSFFDFNGNPSYRYLGAITFVDDYGSWEVPQNLGFANAVYCCKAMHKATGVVMRVKDGVTGTFTTWT